MFPTHINAVLTGIDLASSIKDLDKITNATLTKEVVLATDFSILIGGGTKIPLLRGLRPKVNLDTMTGKFLSGIKSPTAVLTTANGKNSCGPDGCAGIFAWKILPFFRTDCDKKKVCSSFIISGMFVH